MAAVSLRRILLRSQSVGNGCGLGFQRWGFCSSSSVVEEPGLECGSSHDHVEEARKAASKSRWKTLRPVPLESAVRALEHIQGYNEGMDSNRDRMKRLTALRWVAKCCPDVPHSLINKLFRLRQIRMQVPEEISRLVRVSAKDTLEEGAVLCIPAAITQNVQKTTPKPAVTVQDVKWLRSLVLHKDKEIIIVNKPSGLAVQGGSEVVRSLDSLMEAALSYDYNEGPRLVHRLDKETSGALVIGRTHQSTVFLQALLRDKTAKMSQSSEGKATTMERCYWALVIGSPEAKQGRISAPLAKVVTDNGKLDKMRVVQDSHPNAQEAITDYKVLGSSILGCSWLELRPLTGRKHQIRVHLAEVLNTPIVGDYKYGWGALRVWPPTTHTSKEMRTAAQVVGKLKEKEGHVWSSKPHLHLHCRQLTLPNVSKSFNSGGTTNCSGGSSLDVVAPLPAHMVLSWNVKPLDGFPMI